VIGSICRQVVTIGGAADAESPNAAFQGGDDRIARGRLEMGDADPPDQS